MNELINDMLKYVQTGKIEGVLKEHLIKNDDMISFNVMVSAVLSWLRLGYKKEIWRKDRKYVKQKPLELNLNHTWCRLLKDITETNQKFMQYFFISGEYFDFKENVTQQERIEVMKLVYDNFSFHGLS